jgi:hypothetical protein
MHSNDDDDDEDNFDGDNYNVMECGGHPTTDSIT